MGNTQTLLLTTISVTPHYRHWTSGADNLMWASRMKGGRQKFAWKRGHCVEYGAPHALHVLWLLFVEQYQV
jgi:hypothetical protein